MGQYYLLVNDEKKQYLSPRWGYKALETFNNDAEFFGKSLMLLYQDLSCIEQGGGDIPYSELLNTRERKMIGAWNKTTFSFRGDYSDIYERQDRGVEDGKESDYKNINAIMLKIIQKIK